MTTEERLAEIEERANAATPGLWEAMCNSTDDDYEISVRVYPEPRDRWAWIEICETDDDWGEDEDSPVAKEPGANMRFIAHARSDIPWLIARVRELEAQAKRDVAVCKAASLYFKALDDYTEHSMSPLLAAYEKELDKCEAYVRAALAAHEKGVGKDARGV